MAISQTKYINIVSAVGGAAQVGQRDLIGRVFTTNYLVPAGQIIEFSGGATAALESVGSYFGITSAEYEFAAQYFQTNTKNATAPNKISFARYVENQTAAIVVGSRNATSLAQLQALTAGTLTITINGEEKTADAINLSAATSLADAAQLVTAALDSAATCTYDATTARFSIATPDTGAGQTLTFATGTVAQAMGLTADAGVLSDGADAATPLESVTQSIAISNNCFGLYFLDTLATADITALAQWVSNQNVRYMLSLTVTPATATEIQNAVSSFDGIAVTVDKFDANAGFMPVSRIASIDWTRPNAVVNMNYQQFSGVTPSVQDNTEAASYDALGINYYGSTQQAGSLVSWYQPGVLQGTIKDMGVYASEAWLKDSIFTNILNLRLGLNSLPANDTGVGMVVASITSTVNQALYNGTILPGKTLDANDKSFITQLTANPDAWQSVQTGGYYLSADLVKYVENGVSKFKVSYLLVYSKGDSINYVDGRDILI